MGHYLGGFCHFCFSVVVLEETMFHSFISSSVITAFLLLFSITFSVSNAGYLGGRAFITGKPSYKSGPCYIVEGLETCPIGYTPCILGRCYYFPDHPSVVHKKNETA
uniref:Uncharacterized protein n=1 Tax=Panagrolaimus sp. ES5 TaxID=591445 RepID=A0AC34EZJ8_9BILA